MIDFLSGSKIPFRLFIMMNRSLEVIIGRNQTFCLNPYDLSEWYILYNNGKVTFNKTISDDSQEMPQSQPSRDEEHMVIKQTPRMKPPTPQQSRTAIEESSWNCLIRPLIACSIVYVHCTVFYFMLWFPKSNASVHVVIHHDTSACRRK